VVFHASAAFMPSFLPRFQLLNKLGIIRAEKKRGEGNELPHKLASNVTSAFWQIGLGESHTETRNFVNILCINTYHLEMAFDTASNNIYLANTHKPTYAQRAVRFIRPKEQVGPQNLQIKSGLRQLNEFTNDWTLDPKKKKKNLDEFGEL